MKIALIDPSLFTWPYDSELARGHIQNGNQSIIFGKHINTGDQGKNSPLLREVFYPGFQCRHIQNLPKGAFLGLKGLMHPLSLLRLLRQLQRFKPDVIHFQWAPLPLIDRFFLPLFRRIAPIVLTVHDSMPFNNNPRSRLQRLGAIAILHQFDALIVHTEQARQRMTAHGVPASRMRIIPHGVLESDILNLQTPAVGADSAEKPVTLLLFGKVKPYKGTDLLIRALALLPETTRARCRLRIIGKPYMDMEPLTALARELKVEDRIVWDLRFISDAEMPGIFADADIMVMPYREIDASGVLMVALAAERPIVASRIGLFGEMLQDGKHGYLVPPEDPAALAKALALLIDNREQRLAMGQQVHELRASIPDWGKISLMTTNLYNEVINKHS